MTGDNKNNKTATTKAKRKKKQEKRVTPDHDKNKSGNTLSSSYNTNPSVPATTINYNMEDNNSSDNKHQEPPPLSSLQRAMKQQLNNKNNTKTKDSNETQEAVQQRMKKKLNNNQQTSVARSKASSNSLLSKSTEFYSRNQPVRSKASSREESVEFSKATTGDNSNNNSNPNNHHRNPQPRRRRSSRLDYKLGQTARSPSHMIGIEGLSPEQATGVVDSLSNHDFAFVKRSDGSFTYAVLAFRSVEDESWSNFDNDDDQSESRKEDCMTFVLSNLGTSKLIKRSLWGEFVRLVCPEDDVVDEEEEEELPQVENVADVLEIRQEHQEMALIVREAGGGGDAKSNAKSSPYVGEDQEEEVPQSKQQQEQQRTSPQLFGFREDYALGDTARDPSHMIVEPNPEKAMEAVTSLSKHDFAFVKRSDGLFSYAILGFRSDEGATTQSPSHNDSITFVLSGTGCTKMLKRSQWVEFVRLVNMENVCGRDPELPPVVTTNIPSSKRDRTKDPKPAARGSGDGNNKNEENREEETSDAKAEVREDYLNKLRTEFYRTRGPPTVGEVPPDVISFDMAEDDLISCISTQLEDNDEDLESAKYAPSQPVILE
mmetsp:Transcript_17054/g.36990  ORF Transcript_17054/g.36990 Transcript_17054/m.36990 type:complete len:600 (+) Transcript_17054:628-2427(+)